MVSLAPVRYSRVMGVDGGPIARVDYQHEVVFGRPCVQAVSYLRDGLVDSHVATAGIPDRPDGAGTHTNLQVACHMAISAALERWAAHHYRVSDCLSDAGMQHDGSKTGFAAFPGLFKRQARKAALQKSIERHCLIGWWEGYLGHRCLANPWPLVTAIQLNNPFSRHSVVLVWTETEAGYAFAFGAGRNTPHAMGRALIELERTSRLLRAIGDRTGGNDESLRHDVFERRIAFFASEEGRTRFMLRLARAAKGPVPALKLVFDAAVSGPWDRYATVWRTVIQRPHPDQLEDSEDYFFW